MFVTFFDTCMVSLAALIVWRLNAFLVFGLWLTIACLDGLYLSSALEKVPDGAWFTLTLSGILASLLSLWRFGKEEQWQSEASDRFPTKHLVKKDADGQLRLTHKFGGHTLSMIKGFGIFFDKAGETTPAVFSQFLSKLIAAPEVMVFFHLRPLETPSVAFEDRYSVSRLGIPNCYRLIVRHGYMDEVISPDLGSLVCEQVRDFIVKSAIPLPVPVPEVTVPPPSLDGQDSQSKTTVTVSEAESKQEMMANDLLKLERAFSTQVLYIIGKEQMKIKAGTNLWREAILSAFLWIREVRPSYAFDPHLNQFPKHVLKACTNLSIEH